MEPNELWGHTIKETFKRWVNMKLRLTPYHIEDLEFGLLDGVNIIKLLEVLSTKQIAGCTDVPTEPRYMHHNWYIAFAFMQQESVPVDHFYFDGIIYFNMSRIVEVVHILIVHYSFFGNERSIMSLRNRLFTWIRGKVPELSITNLSGDWVSGKAIGALVSSIVPNASNAWRNWSNEASALQVSAAMSEANKWLTLPNLVAPAHIAEGKVMEIGMLAYLAQFPELEREINMRSNDPPFQFEHPQKSVNVGQTYRFTIHVKDRDLRVEDVMFVITHMSSNQVCSSSVITQWEKGASVTFTPLLHGIYTVIAHCEGHQISSFFSTPCPN